MLWTPILAARHLPDSLSMWHLLIRLTIGFLWVLQFLLSVCVPAVQLVSLMSKTWSPNKWLSKVILILQNLCLPWPVALCCGKLEVFPVQVPWDSLWRNPSPPTVLSSLYFPYFFIFCNWYECLNVWLTLNLTYGWTKVSECDKFIDMCAYGLRVCGCIYICFCQLLCTFTCMKGIKCLGSMNLWFLLLFKCLELLIRGKYVCTNIHHHDYYYRTPENMNLVCTHGISYIFCSCQDP